MSGEHLFHAIFALSTHQNSIRDCCLRNANIDSIALELARQQFMYTELPFSSWRYPKFGFLMAIAAWKSGSQSLNQMRLNQWIGAGFPKIISGS